ncbi:hypothetical protein HPB52_001021 [Rhipicephalus sanguineus]|uniref:Uncharacterized protein n=1 Tax=Rhipicephalus sanguineus TaxID=34632 RepID=A0A9D4PBF0_RHISA|nr:hypothetical protein HPB52_001021 [Rhipicephalus sanguineus]
MSDNEFRQMLLVSMVKQQAATYTNGLYVFSAMCSGKVLSDGFQLALGASNTALATAQRPLTDSSWHLERPTRPWRRPNDLLRYVCLNLRSSSVKHSWQRKNPEDENIMAYGIQKH